MIEFETTGSFKTDTFLQRLLRRDVYASLVRYGEEGVRALSNATPRESGETAGAWSYRIIRTSKNVQIIWYNGHVVQGRPVAILLQYGHATRNGGYVQGRDYINPAIKPIFDRIANDVWTAVKTG